MWPTRWVRFSTRWSIHRVIQLPLPSSRQTAGPQQLRWEDVDFPIGKGKCYWIYSFDRSSLHKHTPLEFQIWTGATLSLFLKAVPSPFRFTNSQEPAAAVSLSWFTNCEYMETICLVQLELIPQVLESCYGLGLMFGPPLGGCLYSLAGFYLPFWFSGVSSLSSQNLYVMPSPNNDPHGRFVG